MAVKAVAALRLDATQARLTHPDGHHRDDRGDDHHDNHG
jgi:hypothetical protein